MPSDYHVFSPLRYTDASAGGWSDILAMFMFPTGAGAEVPCEVLDVLPYRWVKVKSLNRREGKNALRVPWSVVGSVRGAARYCAASMDERPPPESSEQYWFCTCGSE